MWLCLQSANLCADPVATIASPQLVCDCKVQTPSLIWSCLCLTACMWSCLESCRPLHWSCCHLCLLTACMWLCLQSAYSSIDPIGIFALPQRVCDHNCKVQTPLLILLLPLPSHSMYVTLAKCRPFTDPVIAFSSPQGVCDHAFKVQTPTLILLPPLPSHSMYVFVFGKCVSFHWSHWHLCLITACMWPQL